MYKQSSSQVCISEGMTGCVPDFKDVLITTHYNLFRLVPSWLHCLLRQNQMAASYSYTTITPPPLPSYFPCAFVSMKYKKNCFIARFNLSTKTQSYAYFLGHGSTFKDNLSCRGIALLTQYRIKNLLQQKRLQNILKNDEVHEYLCPFPNIKQFTLFPLIYLNILTTRLFGTNQTTPNHPPHTHTQTICARVKSYLEILIYNLFSC